MTFGLKLMLYRLYVIEPNLALRKDGYILEKKEGIETKEERTYNGDRLVYTESLAEESQHCNLLCPNPAMCTVVTETK